MTQRGTMVSELRASCHTVIDRWVEQGGKRFKSYRIVKGI